MSKIIEGMNLPDPDEIEFFDGEDVVTKEGIRIPRELYLFGLEARNGYRIVYLEDEDREIPREV